MISEEKDGMIRFVPRYLESDTMLQAQDKWSQLGGQTRAAGLKGRSLDLDLKLTFTPSLNAPKSAPWDQTPSEHHQI